MAAPDRSLPRTPVAASKPVATVAADPAESNQLRRLGFYIALAYVFVRFGMLSEVADYGLGLRAYLVPLLGPPAVLIMLISGGLLRSLRSTISKVWIAFTIWLILVIPFSFWKGGSVHMLLPSFETDFSMFFMIAGLTVTFREFHLLSTVIAISSAITMLLSRIFGMELGGRLSLSFGTLMNPNDYATHLIYTMPFLLMVFLNSRHALRWLCILVAPIGVYVIFRSGSRAALLSLIILTVFIALRGKATQRIAMVVGLCVIALASIALLPRSVWVRYVTMFSSSPVEVSDEETEYSLIAAQTSSAARTRLLQSSLSLMLEHPLFGVGPGQFAVAEADLAKEQGHRAAWQVTHNSYTETGSEAGFPALLMLLTALGLTLHQLQSIYRKTRNHPKLQAIANTAFCLLLSTTGFAICIFFASLEYRFYLPSLFAMTVVFASVAQKQIAQAGK